MNRGEKASNKAKIDPRGINTRHLTLLSSTNPLPPRKNPPEILLLPRNPHDRRLSRKPTRRLRRSGVLQEVRQIRHIHFLDLVFVSSGRFLRTMGRVSRLRGSVGIEFAAGLLDEVGRGVAGAVVRDLLGTADAAAADGGGCGGAGRWWRAGIGFLVGGCGGGTGEAGAHAWAAGLALESLLVGFRDIEWDGVEVCSWGWDAVEEVHEGFFAGGFGCDGVVVFLFAVGVNGVGVADAALFAAGFRWVIEAICAVFFRRRNADLGVVSVGGFEEASSRVDRRTERF